MPSSEALPADPGARRATGRTTVADLIRRHPMGAWLVWFFTVGQALAFAPVVVRSTTGADLAHQPFIVASTLIGLLLPTLVVTRLVDGPAGIHELRRRITAVRVSVGWYLLGLAVLPLTALALTAAFFGAPKADMSTVVSAVVTGLLVQTAIGFVTNNLWEEAAWMGFVQARLQARRGPLPAAV